MIVWLLAIGLVSLLGQVVLLRELNVAFFGSELVYILALGLWLLGSALGAAVGRRRVEPRSADTRILLLSFALLTPLCVVLARALRLLLVGVPGAYLPFPRQLIGMALCLAPLSLLSGLLFQRAAKRYVAVGKTLASAYAMESLGALAGGALATLLLRWGVQNLTAALLCALAALAAASHPWSRRPRWLLPAALPLAALLLVAFARVGSWDRAMTSWNHPRLLATGDTPYGRVTATGTSGQIAVFVNDALAYESQSTAAEEFAHLAALQHPDPGAILILGGGFAGLLEEILRHRPFRVDYVELDEEMLDLVLRHLPDRSRDAMAAAPVRQVIADPRRFLLETEARYDLIVLGTAEPESGQANRFYTREFFTLCARRLNPGGVVALRLRGAENLWTPQLARRTASIHRALVGVLPEVLVLPGTTNIILASASRLERDPAILGDRLRRRGIEARLVIPPYIRYLFTNDRFFSTAERLAGTEAPVNRDARPVCYQLTMLIWLSRFFPTAALVEPPSLDLASAPTSAGAWLALAGLVLVLLVFRRRPLPRRILLAATAGFVGMVLETVLLLDFQTGTGVLYQDLGLLLTLFMAGLALGAAAIDRWMAKVAARSGAARVSGALSLLALAALGLLLAALLQAGGGRGLLLTGFLLLLCGFLVAALFAWAALWGRPPQRETVSPLYAADLAGGCLGSLAAALFLIPAAGLTGAALVAAGAALMALILA